MRYLRPDFTHPLSCSVSGQLNSADGFLHHRRTFDYHVLIMVTEGTLFISSNNTLCQVTAGQYILLPANEEHYGYQPSKGKLSYMWVHFRSAMNFVTICDSLSAKDTLSVQDAHTYIMPETGNFAPNNRAPLLFHQLLDLSFDNAAHTAQMSDYALSLLMMELSRQQEQSGQCPEKNVPPVVVSVAEWIKSHYHEPFSVSNLAERFGYQANYLSTVFKKHMGISLVGYANKLRIETAKNLLANYDLTIKEAAYSCGFPDDKYFMRTFKKLEGITPSEYKTAFFKKIMN